MNVFFRLSFCLLLLAGCESVIHMRGNYVAPEDIVHLRAGETTQAEVLRTLGPPSYKTITAPQEHWYYLGEKQEELSFFRPTLLERNVLSLTFDDHKILQQLVFDDHLTPTDLEWIEDATPTLGRDPSLFKEFFNSIGKYDEGLHRGGHR